LTTIAYRDGVLAGDRRATDDGTIMPGRFRKVYKNKQGWLYGACGDSGPCEHLNRFMHSCPEGLPFDARWPAGKYSALVVSPDGHLFIVEKGFIEQLYDQEFYAMGSGTTPALGAMYMGADAIQAVKIAIEIDSKSGGGVDAVSL
jgi:hypothetical protein